MEEPSPDLRRVVRDEVRAILEELEEGPEPSFGHPQGIARWVQRGLEVAGAILLGVTCGILSHVAVYLLARALR